MRRRSGVFVRELLAPLLETRAPIEDTDLLEELGLDALDLVLVAIKLEELTPENGAFPIHALEFARTVGELLAVVDGWSLTHTLRGSMIGPRQRRRLG